MKLTKDELSWKTAIEAGKEYNCNVCNTVLELVNFSDSIIEQNEIVIKSKSRLICPKCGWYFSIQKETDVQIYYMTAIKPEKMSFEDFNIYYKEPMLKSIKRVADASFQTLINYRETWEGNRWEAYVDGVFV